MKDLHPIKIQLLVVPKESQRKKWLEDIWLLHVLNQKLIGAVLPSSWVIQIGKK